MVYAENNSLLNAEDIVFLQRMITSRDEGNNGIPRAEVVSLIMELKQTSNRKRCENHLDYLIREKRFPFLLPTRKKRRKKQQNKKEAAEKESALDAKHHC